MSLCVCPTPRLNYKPWTTLVGDVDNAGGYAYMEAGSILEISVPYAQFYYEPKTTLKK